MTGPIHQRGLFVTATDTEVGKSYLAGSIAAALTARGQRVATSKPVVTGLIERIADHPFDHELLAAAAGAWQSPEEIAPYRFGPAVSPHLAADEHGTQIDVDHLVAGISERSADADALIVEGAGGLMVPLHGSRLMRDLMLALGLPVVVAARPGLGTINHTLLTLESARSVGLHVVAVVMTPWPGHGSAMQQSNRETIAALGNVEVLTLRRARSAEPEDLASIGADLPLDLWFADRGEPRGAATR